MTDGPTCEGCRHWDATRLRSMQSLGELRLQAPCRVGSPARVAPWKWQWEKACAKFEPEMREPPWRRPEAVITYKGW